MRCGLFLLTFVVEFTVYSAFTVYSPFGGAANYRRVRKKQDVSASTLPPPEFFPFPDSPNFSSKVTGGLLSGNVLSSAALVGGNMVGAGILALPAVTRAPGFLPSSVTMISMWGFCLATAFILAEVCSKGAGEGKSSIQGLAASSLGEWAGKMIGGAFLVSNFLLMTAYIAQGSSLITLPESCLNLDIGKCWTDLHFLQPIIFSAVAGTVAICSPAKLFDSVNNLMVVGILTSFAALVALGTPSMDTHMLVSQMDVAAVAPVVPILLCATTFQNIVPCVSKQLKGEKKAVRAALTLGSFVPLCMYLLWDAIMLGHVDPAVAADSVSTLTSPVSALIGVFSVCAILTSFFGTSKTLYNEVESIMNGAYTSSTTQEKPSASLVPTLAAGAVLIPPAIAAIGCPDAFVGVLNLLGQFETPLLYGVAPALMAWGLKTETGVSPIPGGKFTLSAVVAISLYFAAGPVGA